MRLRIVGGLLIVLGLANLILYLVARLASERPHAGSVAVGAMLIAVGAATLGRSRRRPPGP